MEEQIAIQTLVLHIENLVSVRKLIDQVALTFPYSRPYTNSLVKVNDRLIGALMNLLADPHLAVIDQENGVLGTVGEQD